MKKHKIIVLFFGLVLPLSNLWAQEDVREMVELPDMMRTHNVGKYA